MTGTAFLLDADDTWLCCLAPPPTQEGLCFSFLERVMCLGFDILKMRCSIFVHLWFPLSPQQDILFCILLKGKFSTKLANEF